MVKTGIAKPKRLRIQEGVKPENETTGSLSDNWQIIIHLTGIRAKIRSENHTGLTSCIGRAGSQI